MMSNPFQGKQTCLAGEGVGAEVQGGGAKQHWSNVEGGFMTYQSKGFEIVLYGVGQACVSDEIVLPEFEKGSRSHCGSVGA